MSQNKIAKRMSSLPNPPALYYTITTSTYPQPRLLHPSLPGIRMGRTSSDPADGVTMLQDCRSGASYHGEDSKHLTWRCSVPVPKYLSARLANTAGGPLACWKPRDNARPGGREAEPHHTGHPIIPSMAWGWESSATAARSGQPSSAQSGGHLSVGGTCL